MGEFHSGGGPTWGGMLSGEQASSPVWSGTIPPSVRAPNQTTPPSANHASPSPTNPQPPLTKAERQKRAEWIKQQAYKSSPDQFGNVRCFSCGKVLWSYEGLAGHLVSLHEGVNSEERKRQEGLGFVGGGRAQKRAPVLLSEGLAPVLGALSRPFVRQSGGVSGSGSFSKVGSGNTGKRSEALVTGRVGLVSSERGEQRESRRSGLSAGQQEVNERVRVSLLVGHAATTVNGESRKTPAVPAGGKDKKVQNPNTAQSTEFVERRGKEKEQPKKQRLSKLKKLVLQEREAAQKGARGSADWRSTVGDLAASAGGVEVVVPGETQQLDGRESMDAEVQEENGEDAADRFEGSANDMEDLRLGLRSSAEGTAESLVRHAHERGDSIRDTVGDSGRPSGSEAQLVDESGPSRDQRSDGLGPLESRQTTDARPCDRQQSDVAGPPGREQSDGSGLLGWASGGAVLDSGGQLERASESQDSDGGKHVRLSEAEEAVGKNETQKQKQDPVTYIGPNVNIRYCQQIISSELNAACFGLLSELVRFQDRVRAQDPAKLKMKRRLVTGFREVAKSVRTKRARCIIVAPNIEETTEGGVLDTSLENILESARENGVNVVFALTRLRIAQAFGRRARMSIVAVLNFEGADEQYKTLLALAAVGRREWEATRGRVVAS